MANSKAGSVVPTDNDKCSYESLEETTNFLKRIVTFEPQIGIICGSGLGSLAEALEDRIKVPYEKIPHFPTSTVKGHVGQLVFGYLSGVPVVCMKGRIHYYEGYPLWKCAMPVRVMKLLGISHLIVTNAAGGLNTNFKVGDIMLIKDHINLMGFAGNNPLQGPNDERLGPRFPPMNKAYDLQLLTVAKKIAEVVGLESSIQEGVYACVGGPNYETIAESRLLKMFGVDAVGMSTIHEVITAVHCDLKVLAFSLITNKCIVDYNDENKPNHKEVIDVASSREDILKKFISKLVENISTTVTKE